MRTWMKLIPAVLLAVPFTGPALAADAETDKKIDQLQKDVAQLRKDIEQLRKDLTDNATQRNATIEELHRIGGVLDHMARDQERIARYGPSPLPPGGGPPAPLPNTGTITVQNTFRAPATVRINGRPWVVTPGQPLHIDGVPTGTFQYSVDVEGFGTVEPPRTDNLPAAGYRITIFPKMPY
jgi:outer membrane murein-binding lipoprotein Lpp